MMPQRLERPQASAANTRTRTAAPTQHSMWSSGASVNKAFAWPHGLPMEPFIMQEDSRLGPNSHLTYNDGNEAGQNVVSNDSSSKYSTNQPWTLSATDCLQRHASVFNGSELETNISSLSPKSFFSEPSDSGKALGSDDMADQMSPGNSWGEFGRASPRYATQPHMHLQSPFYSQPTMLNFDSHLSQQVSCSNAIDSALRQTGLGIGSSVEHIPTSVAGRVDYLGQQLSLPYYQQSLVPTSSYQAHPSTYSTNAHTGDSSHSYESDVQCDAPMQDGFQVARTVETQAQRRAEDHILVEGKAKGLTYKEIRKKLGTHVAESTLRGRYRSLMKPRKDRVRKPVWTEKDVSSRLDIQPVAHVLILTADRTVGSSRHL
jgi:hypothetical protein